MSFSPSSKVLITGGNGFIGSHLARRLRDDGCAVSIIDNSPDSYFSGTTNDIELIVGDIRDVSVCRRALQGVDTVVHLAANMGGMGMIHEPNDHIIYRDNHKMTTNILVASAEVGVQRFLYASSACVYPDSLQGERGTDVSLRESDVWTTGTAPTPQGLYGLEKLHSEVLLQLGASNIDIRIARFHNIYGPHGTWKDGREKVPAAILRKLIAGSLLAERPFQLEIWGDGTQRRSFCYIDDAIDGLVRLLHSDCREPLNLGSDRAVTINELVDVAASALAIQSSDIAIRYDLTRPVGVGSRNSNNEKVREALGWEPRISLEDGMRKTGEWIRGQIDKLLQGEDEDSRIRILQNLGRSELLYLRPQQKVFAALLPITSRIGPSTTSADVEKCLRNLARFAESLEKTTHEDVHGEEAKFHIRVYLAIDHDDALLQDDPKRAEMTLIKAGITDVRTLECNLPKGHVCSLWRLCARRAYEDDCDFYALLGDDVVFQDDNWLSSIHNEFAKIAEDEGVPIGFGCVAFTDTTFPGMPTFPVLHRIHLDIFQGQVVPDVFINQDGDPYLFQLYRRFGSSKMVSSRISNGIGGGDDARYEKQHAKDWTFAPLDEATCTLQTWLGPTLVKATRRLTVDVVVPCYRVNMEYLDRFFSLDIPPTCSVMFIIIIDDPRSPNIESLLSAYGQRPDVRIRVNKTNLGASASRNRGLQESSAEWVHFLDDDVRPDPYLLHALEECIRASPDAAGFVGNAQFPPANSIYTAAVHLAGVTYFWDIATKIQHDVPWGVTANLTARRNVRDNVMFSLLFPKTGGGEDIDYCRRKRQYSIAHGGQGFIAAPDVTVTHPWWNGGNRYYWRFYMWSKGDGALISLYKPGLVYRDHAPNSAELLFLSTAVTIVIGGLYLWAGQGVLPRSLGPSMIAATLIANLFHDLYRHLWRDEDNVVDIKTNLVGYLWVLAVLESTLIRMFSELGRLAGLLERGEVCLIGYRFDWFAGVWGDGPKRNERKNSVERFVLWVTVLAWMWL
ncbi:hypothetical protein EIP86_010337 [Pleurotus ostreatoroseus]|nr:hypothetical protein EIP86_010337 [Pleurotus ostreatoroseus]